jgi:hypothetical protein
MKEIDVDRPSLDVPLAEMIQTLRRELMRAQAEATGEKIRFELEKVELELNVVVTRTGKGHAGVEFWVVSAGGEYEKKGEMSHTIKLTLNTKESGKNILVSEETAEKPRQD